MLPSGINPDGLVNTGCLASPEIRGYNRAYVRGLIEACPQITGFRPVWPEYPCYKLNGAFQDFSPHVKAWAEIPGFHYLGIQREVGAFYEYLHGKLTNADPKDLAGADGPWS